MRHCFEKQFDALPEDRFQAGTEEISVESYDLARLLADTLNGPETITLSDVDYVSGFLTNVVVFNPFTAKGVHLTHQCLTSCTRKAEPFFISIGWKDIILSRTLTINSPLLTKLELLIPYYHLNAEKNAHVNRNLFKIITTQRCPNWLRQN